MSNCLIIQKQFCVFRTLTMSNFFNLLNTSLTLIKLMGSKFPTVVYGSFIFLLLLNTFIKSYNVMFLKSHMFSPVSDFMQRCDTGRRVKV